MTVGLEDTQAAPASDPARTDTLAGGSKPAQPTDGELPAGLRLGHFRVDRKLGAGGMGEVYLATDLALDRPVALKVLPAGTASGTARERMIREARAQARIQHANVAHIYFIGEEDGRLYFAMEYIAGKTLAERLTEGPLPVDDALDVIRAATLGLREAQRSGFTHRDVKPSNLMQDGHGVLKLLDFGLVAAAPEEASDGPVAQTTLAGTPLYMAPEQAKGQPIDFRADIYALGTTLYHLVSGKPPFQADSVEELVTLHAGAARPAVPRTKHTPRTTIAAIDALIARMMAARPEDRFASYDELLRAIEMVSAPHTKAAGVWTRVAAGGVDLFAVVLVLVLARSALFGQGDVPMGLIGMPVLAVYQWLAIARWGSTLGMALFEIEVISIDTGRKPTLLVSLRRTLAYNAVLLLLVAIGFLQRVTGFGPIFGNTGDLPLFVLIVLMILSMIHAALRVPNKRTPWDRLSGTLVRYRTARRGAAAAT